MRRALALARRGVETTSPNPCVGAVIVRKGRILGEGWHRAAGLPHAEVEAIRNARRKGANPRGATLYVTLEPCCTHGRTPPCTEAIVAAGIHRVVAGATDPNRRHRGRGFRLLRKAGITVVEGVVREECTELNRAWNHWMVHGTPWVIAKCGMTLDGKIATADGESRWITSERARAEAQRWRGRADAVLVGVNTVLRDDPLLTVRRPGVAQRHGWPLRVVLDAQARTPPAARILTEADSTGVWIMVGRSAPSARVARLRKAGAKVFVVGKGRRGGVDLAAVLRVLGGADVTNLLVEGGGEVLGSFFRERRVQEVVFFIAPRILGGERSLRAVAGAGFPSWRESLVLEGTQVRKVGDDLMVQARVGGGTTRH